MNLKQLSIILNLLQRYEPSAIPANIFSELPKINSKRHYRRNN